MKITVQVRPESSQDKVEKIGESTYKVWVRAPAQKGLANMFVKNALADYFQIPHNKVRLVSGFKSTNKIFEIEK